MKTGNKIKQKRANWKFDKNVTDNFVDHVTRSVPGYSEGHEIVCQLSDFFALENSICYEIGSSTGELTKKIANHNSHKKNIKFVGLEKEISMLRKSKKYCKGIRNIQFVNSDVRLYKFKKSQLIISYYTIQFIPPKDRQEVINKIYKCLEWGGAFIFFEKVRGNDARFQDILVNLYNNFKLKNGFSHEEILNKSETLKGIMEPFSSPGNNGLLSRAGFEDIMTVYRNICFEGILAIK